MKGGRRSGSMEAGWFCGDGTVSSPGWGRTAALYRMPWAAPGWFVPGGRILWCLPGSAEGLRWYPLNEIGKPGSGTEPIHQEHVMCSRFRGSCPSDVKSAGHPEPGFPISLSGYTAALCTPRVTPKYPAAGNKPPRRRPRHPV